MHCTNINWDMTLVDSNAYDFPSPGIPMTNQTWVFNDIPHVDDFAFSDMLWRSVLPMQDHSK